MKTVLVTGGSRGIGKSISTTLAKSHHVVVGYVNSQDKAEEVVNEIAESGGSANSVEINISSKESVDRAFETIEGEYGSVDILINNAGITKDNILPRMKEEEWLDVIQTNLTGSFYTSQRAIKQMMKNKWGRIINISSTGGLDGDKGTLLYSSSKNASHSMIKIMSKEYGAFNITFNTLALGNFNYGLFKKLDKKLRKKILNKIPSKKTGDVKNIYNAIQFLVDSDYVNGSLIKIDGGF